MKEHNKNRRFVSNPESVRRLMEFGKTNDHSTQKIADELGISSSHLTAVVAGKNPCSVTLSVAAEGILRRFKQTENAERVVIALITSAHWPTISMLLKDLGSKTLGEFDSLLTSVEGAGKDAKLVIFSLDNKHLAVVGQLIKTTGGEIKKVVP